MGVAALLDVWGGEAGRAPSGGLRSCACSHTGWGRHHHHMMVVIMMMIKNLLNDIKTLDMVQFDKHNKIMYNDAHKYTKIKFRHRCHMVLQFNHPSSIMSIFIDSWTNIVV